MLKKKILEFKELSDFILNMGNIKHYDDMLVSSNCILNIYINYNFPKMYAANLFYDLDLEKIQRHQIREISFEIHHTLLEPRWFFEIVFIYFYDKLLFFKICENDIPKSDEEYDSLSIEQVHQKYINIDPDFDKKLNEIDIENLKLELV